jgi:2-dehydrotetronate isomerase
MIRFSANTGFLYRDMPLERAIELAAAAGFDAVEFHDEPLRADIDKVCQALETTKLPVCGINIEMGETAGCAALTGYEDTFRHAMEKIETVAALVGAPAIHVLSGRGVASRETFLNNLTVALEISDRIILIEPICRDAMPDYFLRTPNAAAAVITELGSSRLRMMFDCYHIQRETGDCEAAFAEFGALVGHVQIASVPDRSEPHLGTLDYGRLIPKLVELGYTGDFGCEFSPNGDISLSLSRLRMKIGRKLGN